MDTLNATIVFFDSYCLLCNGSVQFILRHEKNHSLLFAPLGGITYNTITNIQLLQIIPDSIVVYHNQKIANYSQAIIFILLKMGSYWYVLGKVASIFPSFILDFFYKIIARNRYRWFGTTDSCLMPSPETRQRFLD
jgi:predicted DCC family thiol-disulfide oxidoreductase YuxK